MININSCEINYFNINLMGYKLSKVNELYSKDNLADTNIPFHIDILKSTIIKRNICSNSIRNHYIEELKSNVLRTLPITSYFEAKTKSDLLYSHPDLIEMKLDNFSNIKGN